ncbi:hypothetical protein [Phenylobacterium sp.]|uniref:hypothetical protein n=1 Tax=Phenylobacterium sp. TaxID=1871053 RepID=UPI00301DB753
MVTDESSIDQRFGEAALGLSEKFKSTPEFARAQSEGVRIRLEFLKPLDPILIPRLRAARFKTDKRYKLGPPGPYFPDRAFRYRQSGMVLVDCKVADDVGRLRDCRLAVSVPEGWGFDEAVMRMARDGWMMADAEPVGTPAPADGYWRFRVDFPRPPYDWRMHSRPLPK